LHQNSILLLDETPTLLYPKDVISTSLIHPFVITVAANKNQSKTVTLCHIAHEKDRLIVPAICAVSVVTPSEGWIITHCARYSMQNIPNFLFQIETINERLIRSSLCISTKPTGILQTSIAFVLLITRSTHAT
jgi:hypothetical protein